jgi:Zn-dependent oligopeptidase
MTFCLRSLRAQGLSLHQYVLNLPTVTEAAVLSARQTLSEIHAEPISTVTLDKMDELSNSLCILHDSSSVLSSAFFPSKSDYFDALAKSSELIQTFFSQLNCDPRLFNYCLSLRMHEAYEAFTPDTKAAIDQMLKELKPFSISN